MTMVLRNWSAVPPGPRDRSNRPGLHRGTTSKRVCARVVVVSLGFALWLCAGVRPAAQTAEQLSERLPAEVEGTIAVLPFANLSQQATDDWIGAGIAETVSVGLTQLGLSVTGRGSMRSSLALCGAANPGAGPDDVALDACRQLGVTWLVGGAYQHVGPVVRITAHIVDVRTGVVVRTSKIDGSLSDFFRVQDRIVDALASQFTRRSKERPAAAASRYQAAPTDAVRGKEPLEPGGVTGALTLDLPEMVDGGIDQRAGTGAGFRRPPPGRPTTVAVRTSRPPEIDGRLDDPVWSQATRITQFVQTSPVEGAPGTEDTEVWIAYDSDNLYFAFYAHYSDPGIMRVNRAERDEARGDDSMSVLFDPFMDQQRAYQFSVNGYGVQSDSIVNAGQTDAPSRRSRGLRPGGSGSGASAGGGGSSSGGRVNSSTSGIRGDDSWNALLESRGQPVDDGWTAEMAIPFKSLRYPSRASGQPHRWGFQITRVIRGKPESLVWAPVSRAIAGQLTQMGVLEGLDGLSTSRNLEFLPTLTAVQAGSLDTTTGRFDEGNPDGEMGFGVKYGVTPNLTATSPTIRTFLRSKRTSPRSRRTSGSPCSSQSSARSS